jgi:hypothetical protein
LEFLNLHRAGQAPSHATRIFRKTEREKMSTLINVVIFCAIVYFIFKFLTRFIKGSPGGNDLCSMVSLAEGKGYVYSNSSRGIAVNPETKQVALAKGRLRKTYAFADIREWEAS